MDFYVFCEYNTNKFIIFTYYLLFGLGGLCGEFVAGLESVVLGLFE
jgi:hypothetical protein